MFRKSLSLTSSRRTRFLSHCSARTAGTVLAATVATAAALLATSAAAQTTITQWNFNDSTLNPSTGSGNASNIGGTSSAFAAGQTGTPDVGWNTSAYPASGDSANNKTGGVQFTLSTAGFEDIVLTYGHRGSNTAANSSVVQYTLDATLGTPTWVDFTTFTVTPASSGAGDTWFNRTVDFSSITGLNDNGNAGFRIVSNQTSGSDYVALRSTSTYASGGTWRFDNVTFTGLLIPPPGAKDVTWNTSSGAWNTTAENWTGGGSTFANGDSVTFADSAGGTITVDEDGVSPGATIIDATAGTFTFTGGGIGGTGSLTKSGAGTAVLAAANSFSGGTTISGGVLQANSDAALGGGGVTLDGGTLRAGGAITGSRAISVAAGGGTLDTNGNATTVASVAGAGDFTKDGAGTLTVTGGMPGASGGQLAVAAGTLQLNSTGNIDFNLASGGTGFAGDVVLQNAGRIRVTNSGTLGGGGTIFANGNGGTITVTGSGLDVIFANDIVIADEVSIAIGSTAGNTVTYSGVISGGDGGAGIRFTNSFSNGGGAGTTIISGANTYEGDTRFHNTDIGIVQLAGGNDRLPTGTTLVFGATGAHGGSTLDLNGVNQTVAGITNDVRANVGTITNTNAETKSTFIVSGNSTPANPFSGVIAGNLDLVKEGSGTLTLTGINTYTGITDIRGGSLMIEGAIGSTETVVVGDGAAIGGNGTIAGSVAFEFGSKFLFDPAKSLKIEGGEAFFSAPFGIADLIGLDSSTPLGRYRIIDGGASYTNLLNFGPQDPYDLGGGKSAYFGAGSLDVYVVPEPSTVALAAAGLGLAALAARRRLRKA